MSNYSIFREVYNMKAIFGGNYLQFTYLTFMMAECRFITYLDGETLR